MERRESNVVGVISGVLAVLNGAGLIFSVGYFLHIRNRFMAIFLDFDADMPGGTLLLLAIPSSLWILASVLLLIVLAAKEFIQNKWLPFALNIAFALCGLVCWAAFIGLLLLPLISLIQELS